MTKKIGNLDNIVDWSTQIPFVDVFKQSRAWIHNGDGIGFGAGGAFDLDADGYVRSLAPNRYADTPVFTTDVYPKGEYTLLWDGEGDIGIHLCTNTVVSSAPGRRVINITGSGQFWIRISSVNPANHIRNIRLILPGFDPDGYPLFRPDFIARLAPYNCLRMMDLGRTNVASWERGIGLELENWAQRPKLSDARYSSSFGAPLEIMIALANAANQDMWYCFPHKVDTNYITQALTLIHATLNPGLKLWVEYSNEVWNGQFGAHHYAYEQALLDSEITENHVPRYVGKRSKEIFTIAETIFGGTSRLRRIMPGQGANGWIAEQALRFQNVHLQTDMVAIAAYFNPYHPWYVWGTQPDRPIPTAAQILAKTPEQVLDDCVFDINVSTRKMIRAHQAHLRQEFPTFAKPTICYEAGIHVVADHIDVGGNNPALTDQIDGLFQAANRHPKMKNVFKYYILMVEEELGVGSYAQFVHCARWSRHGYWGALERWDQPSAQAPKYAAIEELALGNLTVDMAEINASLARIAAADANASPSPTPSPSPNPSPSPSPSPVFNGSLTTPSVVRLISETIGSKSITGLQINLASSDRVRIVYRASQGTISFASPPAGVNLSGNNSARAILSGDRVAVNSYLSSNAPLLVGSNGQRPSVTIVPIAARNRLAINSSIALN